MKGKVVWIAGASRGVGRALSLALADEGAHLLLAARDEGNLASLTQALEARGTEVEAVACDLSLPESASMCVEAGRRRWGGLDALIYTAGVTEPDTPLPRSDTDRLRETFETNLHGALWCARAFIAASSAGPRRLVLISSGIVAQPAAGAAAYTATKAGLEGLVSALARDTEGTGVCVSALRLGALDTDMTRQRFPATYCDALPSPKAGAEAIHKLLLADPGRIHGRTLAAWRLARDPAAEIALAHPAAGLRTPPVGRARLQRRGLLALDRLENPFGPPPAARTALSRAANAPDLHTYPDEGHHRLRQTIAARLGLTTTRVCLASGASKMIERALRLFVRPGDNVLCTDPTWPGFEALCAAQGVNLKRIPFRFEPTPGRRTGTTARFDLDAILSAVDTSTRLIYLVNPSNPTGAALDQGSFEAFRERLPSGATVLLDEAYIEWTSAPHVLQGHRQPLGGDPDLIVVRTFSKFYGLASLRIGYALASPHVAGLLQRLESPYELSTLSAAAATAALGDDAHANLCKGHMHTQRDRLKDALDGLGVDWLDSEASFILAHLPGFAEACATAGILIPPGTYHGRYTMCPIGRAEHTDKLLAIVRGCVAASL